jgi:inosose dehydratase
LRQSQNGTWSEAFGPGDIDYERLADYFKTQGRHPHLVMEQAVENGSPHTMTGVEAHKQSLAYAKKIFG